MDELIIRVLNGSATPEEAERLARWREASPANEERFRAVGLVWRSTAPDPLAQDVDDAVVARIVKAAEAEGPVPRPATGRRGPASGRARNPWLRWGLPLAAAIAAIALGVSFWPDGAGPRQVFLAPERGTETFVLEDGSFVRLAAGARLEEDAGSGERRYALDGLAFFAVASMAGEPFVVDAGEASIRVVGTRFAVGPAGPDTVRVVVLEGRVEVSNGQGRVALDPGDVALATPGAPPRRTPAGDPYELLEGLDGALLFHGTPLARVARELERWYGARVVVEGARLQATTVSAWFADQPFRDVVQSLCDATGARCAVSDTLAVLR